MLAVLVSSLFGDAVVDSLGDSLNEQLRPKLVIDDMVYTRINNKKLFLHYTKQNEGLNLKNFMKFLTVANLILQMEMAILQNRLKSYIGKVIAGPSLLVLDEFKQELGC
jgi:hypothetical protein